MIGDIIESEEQLRAIYGSATENSIKKQKNFLDEPSKRFIQDSPFLCLASSHPNGSADCSPKGDPPGFVKILDDKTLLIPDRKGNNRIDSLVNIIHNPIVGILFFIPGLNETLRVNGTAKITKDPEILKQMEMKGKVPKTALIVNVEEACIE